jgi:hypothetical protein
MAEAVCGHTLNRHCLGSARPATPSQRRLPSDAALGWARGPRAREALKLLVGVCSSQEQSHEGDRPEPSSKRHLESRFGCLQFLPNSSARNKTPVGQFQILCFH